MSYQCSFGGVLFGYEQSDGPSFREPDLAEQVDIADIPYSSDRVIQFGGAASASQGIPIIVAEADWASFKALRRTTATLLMHGSSGTAVLTGLTNIRHLPNSLGVRCTATFSTQW